MGLRTRQRTPKPATKETLDRYEVKDKRTFPELYKRKEYFPPVRERGPKEYEVEDVA
jgi:hypothetical protein